MDWDIGFMDLLFLGGAGEEFGFSTVHHSHCGFVQWWDGLAWAWGSVFCTTSGWMPSPKYLKHKYLISNKISKSSNTAIVWEILASMPDLIYRLKNNYSK